MPYWAGTFDGTAVDPPFTSIDISHEPRKEGDVQNPTKDQPAGKGRVGHDDELENRSDESYHQCYDEACLARSLGISVLPPREDGSKGPLAEPVPQRCEDPDCVADREAGKRGAWKHRQHRRAGETILRRWYLDEQLEGIGLVCGEISHGLLLFEFEGRAIDDGTVDDFLELAEEAGLGDLIEDIRNGCEDESPSGGIHWLVFCDDPITERLASVSEIDEETGKARWAPLIETKGEGGYTIAAPTTGRVHPSGRPWKRLRGGLDTIVRLNPEEVDAVFSLARQFDEKPRSEIKPPRRVSTKANGRPGDDFNKRSAWPEILELHGWEQLHTDSDGWEHWCRPGKDPKGTSATITPDGALFHPFSTSTPFETNRAYTKFAAYSVLNHSDENGRTDWKRAANTLRRDGYGTAQGPRRQREAVVTSMADIEEESVEWFWEDRIPYGNQTVIAGNPGQGKSVLSIDIAARASTGLSMPLTPGEGDPISVILLTAEDSASNTIKPRLQAAGADMHRVFVMEGIREEGGEVIQLMSIPDDIPLLKTQVLETGARLVVIDPLDAFLADHVNSHQNQSIRRALTPLKMMAEETGVAVVAICHLNKNAGASENALYRVNGSIGNTAAARSVLLVAPDPEDDDSRILAPVKANLSRPARSLAFHLEEKDADCAVSVKWDGFSELTKDDLLTKPRAKAKDEAKRFLASVLGEGSVPVIEIENEANQIGISLRTLRRASEEMGTVKKHVDPPGGHWEWSLPEAEEEPE